MTWDDFYDRYSDWAPSTLKARISTLEDIGNGEEVVDVCLAIEDEAVRAQLIRKAMKLGACFTHDDYLNLDGELPDALLESLAQYAGILAANPCFDEHCFDWDDFYGVYTELPEEMLLRCIARLDAFGDREELVEAICNLLRPADDALYQRALACGVRFTEAQLEEMGRADLLFVKELHAFNQLSDAQLEDLDEQIKAAEEYADSYAAHTKPRHRSTRSIGWAIGFGALIGFFKGIFGTKKRHGDCNGDCANCPSHYGYRYGRWYYGHGHHYGCQRGGNRGGGAD